MTIGQNERLRVLLAEARDWMIDDTCHDCERGGCEMRQRIDAALAEPAEACTRCETLRELADNAAAEQGIAQRRMMEAHRNRDEARAEVGRLKALGALQSADIQRLGSRVAQGEADWAALRAEMATAFQRGAEAMREAAAQIVIRELDSWMHSSLTDEIRALPIPEDKP